MPSNRLEEKLAAELAELAGAGTRKGDEKVVTGVVSPRSGLGPRFRLAGTDREFLRMNSNSYLGLSLHPAVIDARIGTTSPANADTAPPVAPPGAFNHAMDSCIDRSCSRRARMTKPERIIKNPRTKVTGLISISPTLIGRWRWPSGSQEGLRF